MGATVESNVIFSSKSYLPRSGMLNLTLDLFGQSVNLLELGARIEGFESLVESFFGPSGVFPDKTIEKVLQSARGDVLVNKSSSVRSADKRNKTCFYLTEYIKN